MQIDGMRQPTAPGWSAIVNWMGEETLVHANEFLVRFRTSRAAAEAFAAAVEILRAVIQAPFRYAMNAAGMATFRLPADIPLQPLLDRLSRARSAMERLGDLAIDWIQPNHVHTVLAAPSPDPFLGDWAYRKIRATEAWSIHGGGHPRVLVGVIDSGIAMNQNGQVAHADLDASRFDLGSSFVPGSRTVRDDNGHGTMIAGIIGATRDNGIGLPGMTRGRVRICKTVDATGHGLEGAFVSAVTEMVNAADAVGAHLILNYSAGGNQGSPELERACRLVQDRGHLLCAASGRTTKVLFPAKYAERFSQVICVGGSSENDTPVGPTAAPVRFTAPGFNIRSTKPTDVINNSPWGNGDGASIATPFVTGLAALIWSKHPDWTAGNVVTAIAETVSPTAHLPVINAGAALAR